MKAGKLRHRITVFEFEAGRSPTGATLPPTWKQVAKVWASIEPLSVKDVIRAQAAGSEISVRCKVRYREDIHTAQQIEHRGERYEIDGDPLPDPDSGIEYMTLMLKKAN